MSWPGVPRFFSLRKDANTHSNGQFVTGANQTRLRFQREYYNLMPKAQLDCRIFFFFLPWAEFDSLQRNILVSAQFEAANDEVGSTARAILCERPVCPRRYNKNGVDLNRNFPDAFESNTDREREKEVRAVMDWLKTESFVLSANLHGGAVVASYPYDNSNGGGELQGGQSISPDDDVFIHLAKTYSYSHSEMHNSNSCSDSQDFTHGITNGYYWYPLPGGMQDYNYVWAQCLELTLEISCCKFPPEAQLPGLWEANKPALLAYMQQVHLGVKGVVTDSNGKPVQNAVVEVVGRRNLCPFRTDRHKTVHQAVRVPYGPAAFSALECNFCLQKSDYGSAFVPPPPSCSTPALEHSESGSDTLLPGVFTMLTLLLLQRLLD
ncbi:Carboxypeptidase M [Labeo rohita]|uniref:Carboxypeptidase M n=1 Tax=Labeo rohita TaxID=84645 RepID=A0ABQ8MT03_LABRO|nr:Carboxypeptidase M [Labeo rohita]